MCVESDPYARTSTIILSHPKPKYRARVYEKLRLITHSLRQLRNYDALYAMISGMQETSVHRLAQTHAFVLPSASSREYQGHVKLFDPRGGYAQYRRTIQEDMDQSRPAIPLLTTIIGLINRLQSTRPEDVREDGSIQWDKYIRFAEILSVIPDCQARGPPVPGTVSPMFKRVIDDTPVIESEDVSSHSSDDHLCDEALIRFRRSLTRVNLSSPSVAEEGQMYSKDSSMSPMWDLTILKIDIVRREWWMCLFWTEEILVLFICHDYDTMHGHDLVVPWVPCEAATCYAVGYKIQWTFCGESVSAQILLPRRSGLSLRMTSLINPFRGFLLSIQIFAPTCHRAAA